LSRDSSSTTSPRVGSSSTTSPTSRIRVPQHVARLVTRLVVDYFASRRLVVDYFDYVAHPVPSTRHSACRVTHRRLLRLAPARRRLLRLRRASGCLGMSRGSSRGSSSTTSPRAGSSSTTSPTPCVQLLRLVARLVAPLFVDYFTYAARPVASAHRAACRVTHRRLLRLAQARRRLLHLRRASVCLGMSCGSSRWSSSTTSPPAHVQVPRHVARLVTPLVVDYLASRRLVVDYFTYAARLVDSARCAACRVTDRRLLRLAQARRRLLHLHRASGCLGTSCGSLHGSSSTTSPPALVRVPRHVARLVA
jgi:hypothetical protein